MSIPSQRLLLYDLAPRRYRSSSISVLLGIMGSGFFRFGVHIFVPRRPARITIITTALRNKPAETVYHISRREIVLSRFSLGSSVTDTYPLEHFDRVFSKLEV